MQTEYQRQWYIKNKKRLLAKQHARRSIISRRNKSKYQSDIKLRSKMSRYDMVKLLATQKPYINGKYLKVSYGRYPIFVHQLVFSIFYNVNILNKQDAIVHHVDGNTLNNHISNLWLVTPKEHGEIHGFK